MLVLVLVLVLVQMEEEGRKSGGLERPGGEGTRSLRLAVEPAGEPAPGIRPVSTTPRDRAALLQARLVQLERLHAEKLAEVHRYDPFFNPDQPVPPVGYIQARALVPDDATVLVQLNFTPEGAFVFLLTRQGVQLVRPERGHSCPPVHVAAPGPTGMSALPAEAQPFGKAQALDLAVKWMTTYSSLQQHSPGWHAAWGHVMPLLLEEWSRRLVTPVLAALPSGTRRLVISPSQASHLIPLHACRMMDGRFVAEAFEVVYTPSFSLLHRCARMSRSAQARELLVQDPTADLHFAPAEGAAYQQRHPNAEVFKPAHGAACFTTLATPRSIRWTRWPRA